MKGNVHLVKVILLVHVKNVKEIQEKILQDISDQMGYHMRTCIWVAYFMCHLSSVFQV